MPIYFLSLFIIISISFSCNRNCDFLESNTYGIDVSHYQNDINKIDWLEVSKNTNPKISFAYLRSTMGKNGIDSAFTYNFKETKKNNIKRGIYHYFRPNENGLEQFQNFHKNNSELGDLPPVIDIEKRCELGGKKLKSELTIFLKKIEETYGIKPIIYTPQKFYNIYFLFDFQEYEFWIARQHGITKYPNNNKTHKEPILFDNRCPIMWQYSGTGNINGINGFVDLNIANRLNWSY